MTLDELLALAERTEEKAQAVRALPFLNRELHLAIDPTTVRHLIAVAQAAERVSARPFAEQDSDEMTVWLAQLDTSMDALHAHLEKG